MPNILTKKWLFRYKKLLLTFILLWEYVGFLYDLKARPIMSIKNKTIALSAVALVVVAGGAYAFMPSDKDASYTSSNAGNVAQPAANQQTTDTQATPNNQNTKKVEGETVKATDPKELTKPDKPVAQAPKKLTKQQFAPPPMTEDEKLRKAAEEGNNF
jgi:nitrate/TMAO reductase-like tetraheme cytochrome c subunit